MAKELNILEQMGFVGANSVTDEEYREFWGESREETLEEMKDFIREFDAKMEDEVYNKLEKEECNETKNERKVAAKKSNHLSVLLEDREGLEQVALTIQELAKKLAEMTEIKVEGETVNVKERRTAAQKGGLNSWALKLVAVKTGSGKSFTTGEPVVIRSTASPLEDSRLVARLYRPAIKGTTGMDEIMFKGGIVKLIDPAGGVKEMKMKDGVKGLMVDVGGLKVGDFVSPTGTGRKGIGPKEPKTPKM